MVEMEKYYIKTRGVRLMEGEAVGYGIRRVYNYTSSMEFMGDIDLKMWAEGLKQRGNGESVIVESAVKEVEGGMIYVSSCIIFRNLEMCNLFYLKNRWGYRNVEGFIHLYN